ncbi:hypothetical protein R0J91_16060, partial [Micrococcus sp. SIMBA_131]
SRYSHLAVLECCSTGAQYDPAAPQNLSSAGATLFARYDLDAVRQAVTPDDIARRPADLWRYHELLPVQDADHVHGFCEGMTPLVDVSSLGR